jgi:hypothetical protein
VIIKTQRKDKVSMKKNDPYLNVAGISLGENGRVELSDAELQRIEATLGVQSAGGQICPELPCMGEWAVNSANCDKTTNDICRNTLRCRDTTNETCTNGSPSICGKLPPGG